MAVEADYSIICTVNLVLGVVLRCFGGTGVSVFLYVKVGGCIGVDVR